jgi:hypothetical protein
MGEQIDKTWVWRPDAASPPRKVYGIGPTRPDGRIEVVLYDGTRVKALPSEVIAE